MHVNFCPRPSRFLVAAITCRTPIAGHIILACDAAIPIERPIDHAIKGPGKIVKILGDKIFGR